MDFQKTGILIPALNAEKTIVVIIRELLSFGFSKDHIIVIDDGSRDATYNECVSMGVHAVKHAKNKGKGAALKLGFKIARKQNLENIITLDADAQHLVRDIRKFAYAGNGYDVIVGQRVDVSPMPVIRQIVNRTISLIISIFADRYVPDAQCGFRYVKLKVFDRISLKSNRYQIDPEMVYRALKSGYRVGFVPVDTVYRNEQSYIDPLIDTIRFIKMAAGFLWR